MSANLLKIEPGENYCSSYLVKLVSEGTHFPGCWRPGGLYVTSARWLLTKIDNNRLSHGKSLTREKGSQNYSKLAASLRSEATAGNSLGKASWMKQWSLTFNTGYVSSGSWFSRQFSSCPKVTQESEICQVTWFTLQKFLVFLKEPVSSDL